MAETARQDAEQAARLEALGRMAGGLAHDLNNLLTAMLGYCELAEARAGDADGVRADLAEVMAAAQRAASITRQLAAFARRQPGSPVRAPLDALIAGLAVPLPAGARWHAGAGEAAVEIDRDHLRDVIAALVERAARASPSGSVRVETAVDGGHVRLSVLDPYALSPHAALHAFEPFALGHGVDDNGLAMAAAHGLVAQAGGEMRVESGPRGTAFHVLLPRVESAR
jgi:two-component system cell cycle sensor histidine kinase/response regulator CckA